MGSTEDDNDDNSVGGPRGSGDTKVSGLSMTLEVCIPLSKVLT